MRLVPKLAANERIGQSALWLNAFDRADYNQLDKAPSTTSAASSATWSQFLPAYSIASRSARECVVNEPSVTVSPGPGATATMLTPDALDGRAESQHA